MRFCSALINWVSLPATVSPSPQEVTMLMPASSAAVDVAATASPRMSVTSTRRLPGSRSAPSSRESTISS